MNNYINFIKKTIPKVLTQVDRDNHSPTYGCCDRNHWHLKTRDFSSAILQQTGLTMALLYTNEFDGNVFFEHEDIREWAIATVYFWKKIQLHDGSFNEYYPHEHGFPPTAFSLYSVCEVYKRLGLEDDELIKSFEKTAKYLIRHIEPQAYNQEIASITAIYSCYTITKSKWILEGVNKKLERILELQSREGWFSEYGGADIGYLSVSLDMLAEYYWMSKDGRVLEPLQRICSFIKFFIHPDHTVGGEYGSRNTTYFLPNGIEVLIQLGNSEALAIRDFILEQASEPTFFLDSVDDRYCAHYLLHSFIRALEKNKDITLCQSKLPFMENQSKFFPDAGIWVYTNKNQFAIIGAQKGGILKLYLDGKQAYLDCGYRVNYGKGEVAATNWQDSKYQISKTEENSINIKGFFSIVKLKVPTPFLHFGLRIASILFGKRIISFLKKKIILVNKHSNISFERAICLEEDCVVIYDNITSPEPITIECASNFSLRHVASGKFYSISDICCQDKEIYKEVKQLKLKKVYDFGNKELRVNVL